MASAALNPRPRADRPAELRVARRTLLALAGCVLALGLAAVVSPGVLAGPAAVALPTGVWMPLVATLVVVACFAPPWAAAGVGGMILAGLGVVGIERGAEGAPLAAVLVVAGAGMAVVVGEIVALRAVHTGRADRLEAAAREHEALHTVANAAVSAGDVFTVAAREVAHVLAVDGTAIMRLEPDQAVVLGSWDRRPSPVGPGFVVPLSPGGLMEPVREGRTVRVDAHEPEHGSLVEHMGFHTLAAAPIRLPEGVWGAVVASTFDAGALPVESVPRLAELADLLSLAITDADRRRRLEAEATTDGLTGVLNRRAFDDRLDAAVTVARRDGRRLTLALVDVDRFKQVNDLHGHDAGDAVLRRVAAALKGGTRTSDLLGRLGGDEFAILLDEAGPVEAIAALDRARAALGEDERAPVTISVGVAALAPGLDGRALRLAADAALYRSKAAGRDRCTTA